jgi:hypothetical protein
MKYFSRIISSWLLLFLGNGLAIAQEAPNFPDPASRSCEKLCAIPEANWTSIPWEVDLIKAQQLSVEQAKPIFIWSMDGHPLTCT